MVLEFDRTIEDIIDFNLFHMAHSPSVKRQVWIYRILAALLITPIPPGMSYLIRHSVSPFYYIFGVLVGILFFVAYPYLIRRSTVRRIRKMLNEGENKSIIGRCTMTLSPEGISTKTVHSENKIDWSIIVKIVQSEKHVFLYIGSINAFVIPKTAFVNDGAKQEFLDYVLANAKIEALS